MLIGRFQPVRRRITNILLAVAASLLPVILWAIAASLGWIDWPKANSAFGVMTGFIGGAIVFFEMAIWPRKWMRGWRLGFARVWMRLHIWLGIACLPIIVLHAGIAFGGPLAAVTMILFLLVIASGVWGLILQQWIPSKLYTEIPSETVASQVDRAVDKHIQEAANILAELTTAPPDQDDRISSGQITTKVALLTLVTGAPADQLTAFHDNTLAPYLKQGRSSGSPLRSETQSRTLFSRLRASVPPTAHTGISRLEELAEIRRLWDSQVRLNFWLHNWLTVHLPLSVAMSLLMCVHALFALKYW